MTLETGRDYSISYDGGERNFTVLGLFDGHYLLEWNGQLFSAMSELEAMWVDNTNRKIYSVTPT